ncbi:MAG: hypothetical protein ACR2PT_22125, partial [Endozoicomonas sp.]
QYMACLGTILSSLLWHPFVVDIPEEKAPLQADDEAPPDNKIFNVSHFFHLNDRTHIEFQMKGEKTEITGRAQLLRKLVSGEAGICSNHEATQAQEGVCNDHYNVILKKNIRYSITQKASQHLECNPQGCWATVLNLEDGTHCRLESGEPLPTQMQIDKIYSLGFYRCNSMGGGMTLPQTDEKTQPLLNIPSLANRPAYKGSVEGFEFRAHRFAKIVKPYYLDDPYLMIKLKESPPWEDSYPWASWLRSFWFEQYDGDYYLLESKPSKFKPATYKQFRRSHFFRSLFELEIEYKVTKKAPADISKL